MNKILSAIEELTSGSCNIPTQYQGDPTHLNGYVQGYMDGLVYTHPAIKALKVAVEALENYAPITYMDIKLEPIETDKDGKIARNAIAEIERILTKGDVE